MCVEITDAPKTLAENVETWEFAAVVGQWPLGEYIQGSSYFKAIWASYLPGPRFMISDSDIETGPIIISPLGL